MIRVREARNEDRESAIRVLWKAFESTQSFEDILKQEWIKRWHQPEDNDWAYVAVDSDKVVANLCFFKTDRNIIRGRPIPFAGVWAVATDPAYRRKGIVRDLFQHVFPIMRNLEIPLTILDPFNRPFYEKFGYALAERRTKHVFKQNALRAVTPSGRITSREITNEKDVDKILEVEKTMARFGSRFFQFRREYVRMIKENHFYLLEKGPKPVGTVKFWFDKAERGFKLIAGILRYTTDEALPSIIELVRNHGVNAKEISLWADTETPVRHFIDDIHKTDSFQIGSMMMRVIDFESYCRSISVPKDATETVTIELKDNMCEWNNGVYAITPNGESLDVVRNSSDAEIILDALQLSKVIAGQVPPIMLEQFNEISCSKETARNLEAIFPSDNFVSYCRF